MNEGVENFLGEGQQETVEAQLLERELRENDLLTSDAFLEEAKSVLDNSGIPFVVESYTSGAMIDPENETRVPAEFVLVIMDSSNPENNADLAATQRAHELIKGANVVVRYARPRGNSSEDGTTEG